MDTACTMVLLTFWSLQEASSEFEVVNIDGKTSDALTVRTRFFVTKIKINNFSTTTGSHFFCCSKESLI